jgi:predicted O-linked N-acetylglucosamine transferase (SPINDLY family)
LPEAHNNLGNALKDQGDLDGAIAAYREALRLKPDDTVAGDNLLCALLFHPDIDEKTIAEERRRWNRQISAPRKQVVRPLANDRSMNRRLRIGYVSPDFCGHVIGRNLRPLFQRHDRGDFEIFCYSGVLRPDKLTEEFRERAGRWRSTVGMGDEELAELIRRDGVDILVDLTQHLAGNRLGVFARQPAPVQVSFAGYPEGTGLEAIEHRISDRHLEAGPGDEGPVKNERVHLIDSFWCYDPCGVEVEVNALPAMERGEITFGCLNNFCKINERVLSLWARTLGSVTGSRLVLQSRPGRHRQRTLEFFEGAGIEGRRVEFVDLRPQREYLELYHRLDMVLDTFPYNGHTTSLEALWMGAPVVSLAGKTPVSRAGLSQLTNLGLPELVARSEAEYVASAANLARDLPRLAELRSTLRERMRSSVLMDAARFARSIEAAYRVMWAAGKP